jgi:trehalose 6-phosphate phosphatase
MRRMTPLSNGLEPLIQATSGHPDDMLLVVASLDGALAEYQDDPAHVYVTPARLDLLKCLQRQPGVVLAVVSGRPLDDLRSRIPLDEGAYYIGLHGLEIVGPHFVQACRDGVTRYRDCMLDVAARLHDVISDVPGVRVEYKGPIVALHTRKAAPEHVVWSRFHLLSAAANLFNEEAVRPLRGHDVLELVPNVGSPRAEALCTVRQRVEERHHRTAFTIYIGEDVPDDGALNALGERGVVAVVGRRTHVEYHLESCDELDALIRELITSRIRGDSAG